MNIDSIYNEEVLIREAAAGNEQAYTRLVTPLFDRLFGFAVSVTKSAALAEEVVQDVFVQIWQHRAELPDILNFHAWVNTIARNRAYNALRQQLQHDKYVQYLDTYFAVEADSPEQRVLLQEALSLLKKAAGSLPTQQELVFTMSRLEGQTLDEIAERLSLSKATVKKHLTKALKGVREYMHRHSDDMLLIACLCTAGILTD